MTAQYRKQNLPDNQQPWARYLESQLADFDTIISNWPSKFENVRSKVQQVLNSLNLWRSKGIDAPQFTTAIFQTSHTTDYPIAADNTERTFVTVSLATAPTWAKRADLFVDLRSNLSTLGTADGFIWVEVNGIAAPSRGPILGPVNISVDLRSASRSISLAVRGRASGGGTLYLADLIVSGGAVFYPNEQGLPAATSDIVL